MKGVFRAPIFEAIINNQVEISDLIKQRNNYCRY